MDGHGNAVVDGALLTALTPDGQYTPGRSLEFVATFGAAANQHVGLGVDVNNVARWAMFSTMGTTNTLYARTNNDGVAVDTQLTGNFVGGAHRYRIDWTGDSVVFSIDGTIVHTQSVAIGGTMRPLASDYTVGGAAVTVDWLRMSPYPATGTFTSRVHDAGSVVDWRTFDASATTPAGTGVTYEVRTGNTAIADDGTWSTFTSIADGATSPAPRATSSTARR